MIQTIMVVVRKLGRVNQRAVNSPWFPQLVPRLAALTTELTPKEYPGLCKYCCVVEVVVMVALLVVVLIMSLSSRCPNVAG